jgi:hypothetical protein
MATKSKKASRLGKAAGDVIITENAILITLDAKSKAQAKRCLAKNGKIVFSLKEHSATRLPQVLENGKLID